MGNLGVGYFNISGRSIESLDVWDMTRFRARTRETALQAIALDTGMHSHDNWATQGNVLSKLIMRSLNPIISQRHIDIHESCIHTATASPISF